MKVAVTILILIIVGVVALFLREPNVRGCAEWTEVTRAVVVDAKGSTLEYVERVCQKDIS